MLLAAFKRPGAPMPPDSRIRPCSSALATGLMALSPTPPKGDLTYLLGHPLSRRRRYANTLGSVTNVVQARLSNANEHTACSTIDPLIPSRSNPSIAVPFLPFDDMSRSSRRNARLYCLGAMMSRSRITIFRSRDVKSTRHRSAPSALQPLSFRALYSVLRKIKEDIRPHITGSRCVSVEDKGTISAYRTSSKCRR